MDSNQSAFKFIAENADTHFLKATKFRIYHNANQLTFDDVISLWSESSTFRAHFRATITQVNKELQYPYVFFESPPITATTLDKPYEFVLVKTTAFRNSNADPHAFADKFALEECRNNGLAGACSFPNLGRDAIMIVPKGRPGEQQQNKYTNLMNFMLDGEASEVDDFWTAVGRAARARLSERSMWISTCGTAVDWLHMRLDSRPKYYSYEPYKRD